MCGAGRRRRIDGIVVGRRVGASGSVLAVDRNVTLLRHLAGLSNIEIVEAPIEELEFLRRPWI